jgi:hypothetical protein
MYFLQYGILLTSQIVYIYYYKCFVFKYLLVLEILYEHSNVTTRHEGAWWERRYSSYSFYSLALDGGEWSASRLGRALAPGKGPPVPIVQETGWAPEPVWTQRLEDKSFRICRGSNLDRPFVQPVARHYIGNSVKMTSSLAFSIVLIT